LSVGVLLEDVLIVAAGLAIGVAGVVLVVALGRAVFEGIEQLASFPVHVVPVAATAMRVGGTRCRNRVPLAQRHARVG
jgi:hypothetical protein